MATRLRVGVIGCGVIAQVMHLHYLAELSDRFELVALCDAAEDVCAVCATDYRVPQRFTRWQDLLRAPIDAVLILTSGSHAPIAVAAAEAGLHVLVEKPLCFSVAEGRTMIAAAERAGVTLMVAYNKRYDPAWRRLVAEARGIVEPRLLRITTLESPFEPYLAHYRLHRPTTRAAAAAALESDTQARITAAIGPADPLAARAYHLVLLDSMVHEFNAVRCLLGEPDRLDYAEIGEHGLTAVLRFGATRCIIAWVDLPGMARYQMEFALYAPERRLTLAFPSPFLRNMPTLLSVEGGEAGTAHSWKTEEVSSYAESFREELLHFHDCVTTGKRPLTTGVDALGDIALCEAVVTAHRHRTGINHPTATAAEFLQEGA